MRKLKIQHSWFKKRISNKFNHTLAIIFFSKNKFWHPLKIAIVLNLYSTFFSSIQKFIVFIFQAAAATTMQLIASTSLLNKNQLEIRSSSRNRKIPDPYYPSYRPYNTLGIPHRPLLPHPDFRPISNNSWKLKTYASIIIIQFVDCKKKINNKTFLCLWICRRVVYQSWIITLQCFIRSKLVTDQVQKIDIRVTEIWPVKPMGWV